MNDPIPVVDYESGVYCCCDRLRKAYRRGYNAHATSAAIGAEMYGVPTNQHGKGENP